MLLSHKQPFCGHFQDLCDLINWFGVFLNKSVGAVKVKIKVKVTWICSAMDHTVLPADNTAPASTS